MHDLPYDIWMHIKLFLGLEKYYLLPAKKKIYNLAFSTKISDICFQRLMTIFETNPPVISLFLIKVFSFMIDYNVWIQECRNHSRIWDRFAFMLATRCNNYLQGQECHCQECSQCLVNASLDRMSRVFYTEYVKE